MWVQIAESPTYVLAWGCGTTTFSAAYTTPPPIGTADALPSGTLWPPAAVGADPPTEGGGSAPGAGAGALLAAGPDEEQAAVNRPSPTTTLPPPTTTVRRGISPVDSFLRNV